MLEARAERAKTNAKARRAKRPAAWSIWRATLTSSRTGGKTPVRPAAGLQEATAHTRAEEREARRPARGTARPPPDTRRRTCRRRGPRPRRRRRRRPRTHRQQRRGGRARAGRRGQRRRRRRGVELRRRREPRTPTAETGNRRNRRGPRAPPPRRTAYTAEPRPLHQNGKRPAGLAQRAKKTSRAGSRVGPERFCAANPVGAAIRPSFRVPLTRPPGSHMNAVPRTRVHRITEFSASGGRCVYRPLAIACGISMSRPPVTVGSGPGWA